MMVVSAVLSIVVLAIWIVIAAVRIIFGWFLSVVPALVIAGAIVWLAWLAFQAA